MKRVSLVCLFFIGSFFFAHGQVRFGIQAGLGLSDIVAVNQSQTALVVYSDNLYDIKPSVTLGVSATLPLSERFGLLSLVQYTSRGTRLSDNPNNEVLDLRYASIPLLLRYKFVPRGYVEAGPEFAYLVRASVRKIGYNATDIHNRFDVGSLIGLGWNLSEKLSIGARYSIGLLEILDENNIPSSPPPSRGSGYYNRYLQLFASYTFVKNRL